MLNELGLLNGSVRTLHTTTYRIEPMVARAQSPPTANGAAKSRWLVPDPNLWMKLSFIEELGGSLPLDAIPSTHIKSSFQNQNTYSNRRRGFQVHLKLLQQHIKHYCTNLIWLTTCNNLRSCRKSCGTRLSSPEQFCVSFFSFFAISLWYMNEIHTFLFTGQFHIIMSDPSQIHCFQATSGS